MSSNRAGIARSAAAKLRAQAPSLGRFSAVVGFDGFIDSIIDVVDKRTSMRADDYHRLATISQYAARCAAAAGKSANIELVIKEERFGGNGPLMAGGLAQLGLPTTYIGGVGEEENPRTLHRLYAELDRRCKKSGGEVIAVAAPARTDALEFDDGKLMLGKPGNLAGVNWEAIKGAVGLDELRRRLGGAQLIGMVNWVMMPGVPSIWEGLCEEVLGGARATRPRVFIDLCDPAKRTDADVRDAMEMLRRMSGLAPVTLGLNLSESERIDAVSGASAFDGVKGHPSGEQLRIASERLRAKLGIDAVTIHPREGAAGATAAGESGWFEGPMVAKPKLSTGAGDHFNSGFAAAQVLGLGLEECLAVGCAVSGAYVRDAVSPTMERLAEFLDELPVAEK